jgi:hypothetical protein
MSSTNLDEFLVTLETSLEGAFSCLNDGRALYQKIAEIELNLLNSSPDLISQIKNYPLTPDQGEKIKKIISLISELQIGSNAKLNWFQDLEKHLKRTLANDI